MGKIILSMFVMMSTSVLANDKVAQCFERESVVMRKVFSKNCGMSEDMLKGDGSKLSESQKKCLLNYFEKNKEKYEAEVNKIINKCNNS